MANYTTNQDLVEDVLGRSGELVDGSSPYNTIALRYINRAFQALWTGGSELDPDIHEVWWWLRAAMPGTIVLNPLIDTFTASVANNSDMATLSAISATDLTGRVIKFAGDDYFRISAHGAGSAVIQLDSVYTGVTAAASECQIFQLEYNLISNLMAIISPMRCYREGRSSVTGTELNALDEEFPITNLGPGVPRKFAMVDTRRVRFSHYGGVSAAELIRLDYDYYAIPTDIENDLQECVVPREYRRMMCDYALFFLFSDKNDDRAGPIGQLAKASFQAMVKENRARKYRMQNKMGSISPREGFPGTREGPLRTSSGLIIG